MRGKRILKPSRTKPADLRAAERAAQALDLRMQGTSYREIGKRLNVCPATAYQYVANSLAGIRAECAEKAETLRELEIGKLDKLEAKLWGSVDRNASAAVVARVSAAIVKVTESRRKLLGLDAPQKIEATGNLYTVVTASPACPAWDAPAAPAAQVPASAATPAATPAPAPVATSQPDPWP